MILAGRRTVRKRSTSWWNLSSTLAKRLAAGVNLTLSWNNPSSGNSRSSVYVVILPSESRLTDWNSLTEANRNTTMYAKMEYGVKRLLWLGGY